MSVRKARKELKRFFLGRKPTPSLKKAVKTIDGVLKFHITRPPLTTGFSSDHIGDGRIRTIVSWASSLSQEVARVERIFTVDGSIQFSVLIDGMVYMNVVAKHRHPPVKKV